MSEQRYDRALYLASAATLASRGIGVALSLATSVVVARVWGLEGKGLVSVLAAGTTLAVRLGVIGFDAAVAQFLLVRRVDTATTLGTVMTLAGGAGASVAVLVYLGLVALGSALDPTTLAAARVQAAALPAAFVLFVVTYAFFALGRAAAFAVFDVAYRLGSLAAAVAAAAIGAGILMVVSLQAASAVVAAVASVVLVWRWSGGGWRWSAVTASAMAGYGARAYVYGVGRYLLAYGSLLVSGLVLGTRDAGLFSIALMLGEVVALSSGSVNLAFGRTVAISEAPWHHARRVAARVAILMAALAAGIAVTAPFLIPLVFGAPFTPSATLFLWLAPGVVALGLEQIVGSYFAREGMSWKIAGLMASGAAAAMALWCLSASVGLTSLAAATSLAQVAVAALLVGEFRHATLDRAVSVDRGGSGGARG